jgi:hypothetical protein
MNAGRMTKKRIALAVLIGSMAFIGAGLLLQPSFQQAPTQEGFQDRLSETLNREGLEMVSAISSDSILAPWPWSVRLSEWVSRQRNFKSRNLGGDGVIQYGVYRGHAPAFSIDALCYESRIVRLVIHHPPSNSDRAKSLSLALQKICPSVLILSE